MKHLLSSAIFVTGLFLTETALANDDLCEARVTIKTNPLGGASNVPRNARLPIEWDSGCGKLAVELFDGDVALATRIDGAHFVDVVQPLSPLAANRDHRLVVREGTEVLAELTFKTGDSDAAVTAREAPTVEVRGYRWVDGYDDVADFTVVAKQKSAERLGILSISYEGGGADAKVAGGENEVTFRRGLRAENDVEKCFTVTYTDEAGNVSPNTGRACVTPTGGPEADGCSAARRSKGSTAGLAALVAVAFAFVRRRRLR